MRIIKFCFNIFWSCHFYMTFLLLGPNLFFNHPLNIKTFYIKIKRCYILSFNVFKANQDTWKTSFHQKLTKEGKSETILLNFWLTWNVLCESNGSSKKEMVISQDVTINKGRKTLQKILCWTPFWSTSIQKWFLQKFF